MRKSQEEQNKCPKEQEQIVLDNEEIYINDLSSGEKWDNLDRLFSFFSTKEGEINITAGYYFSEIVCSLINKEPEKILSYIYSRKEVLDYLVDNIGHRFVQSLLKKILNLDKDATKKDINFKFFKHRFTLFRRLAIEAEKKEGSAFENTMEIFIDLVREEENIADGDYFIEKLLKQKKNFSRLFNSINKKKSRKLVELVGLILRTVFFDKENGSDQWVSRKQSAMKSEEKEIEGESSGVKFNFNENYEEETAFDGIEDDLEIEIEVKGELKKEEEEGQKTNQSTAETSKDKIKNLELELFDQEEMDKTELISVVDEGLKRVFSCLEDEPREGVLQSDGVLVKTDSTFKIHVLRLLKIIGGLEYNSVKDVLLKEEVLVTLFVD